MRTPTPLQKKYDKGIIGKTKTIALIGRNSDISLKHGPLAEQAMQVWAFGKPGIPKTYVKGVGKSSEKSTKLKYGKGCVG